MKGPRGCKDLEYLAEGPVSSAVPSKRMKQAAICTAPTGVLWQDTRVSHLHSPCTNISTVSQFLSSITSDPGDFHTCLLHEGVLELASEIYVAYALNRSRHKGIVTCRVCIWYRQACLRFGEQVTERRRGCAEQNVLGQLRLNRGGARRKL